MKMNSDSKSSPRNTNSSKKPTRKEKTSNYPSTNFLTSPLKNSKLNISAEKNPPKKTSPTLNMMEREISPAPSIGEKKEPSPPSKIKDNVDLAGPSLPLDPLKVPTSFKLEN